MHHIKFLLSLILLLTACAPNATPVPLPVVTSSPVVIIPPTDTATDVPTQVPLLVANPLSSETMDKYGEYVSWKSENGSLVVYGSEILIWNADANTWKDPSGKEWNKEALTFVETTGVNYSGEPIGVVPQLLDGEEKKIFGAFSHEWFTPTIDIVASQALIDANANAKPFSFKTAEWPDWHVDFDAIPESTETEVNEHLKDIEQTLLRQWPDNVLAPTLMCLRWVSQDNWNLSKMIAVSANYGQYTGSSEYIRDEGERPDVLENTGIRPVSVVKFKDQEGQWVIRLGVQYYIEGKSVVLHMDYDGEYADPLNGKYNSTQGSITFPQYKIVEPKCSDPQAKAVLSAAQRAQMKALEGQTLESVFDPRARFDLDAATMARLQEIIFDTPSMQENPLQYFLRLEKDDAFENEFPNRKKE